MAHSLVPAAAPEVLWVDDDPDIASLAQLSFDRLAGWRVRAARTVADAIAALDRAKVDVIVVDPELLGGSASDLLRRLRAHPKAARVPLVLASASLPATSAGADFVVRKPFQPAAMVWSVVSLVEGRA